MTVRGSGAGPPSYTGHSSPAKDRSMQQGSHAPSCAHREIAELGRLVGGVPALHDAVEPLRPFVLAIALEPFGLDHPAAQRGRGLLILSGEVVFADRAPDAAEGVERLAVGVQ